MCAGGALALIKQCADGEKTANRPMKAIAMMSSRRSGCRQAGRARRSMTPFLSVSISRNRARHFSKPRRSWSKRSSRRWKLDAFVRGLCECSCVRPAAL